MNDPAFWRSTAFRAENLRAWPASNLFLFFLAFPLSFFFLFFFFQSPSPFLQRCWPARNSTSPLNNGGTLTIFAAVYQDLDPNGSLGEYSFLPAAFSSRPLDENLRMPRINGRLPSSGQTDRDSCQPLPPSVHYVRLSSAAPLLIPSILLREESLRANFSFLPERARRFVMGYINLDFRESNKFSNCKQNFCRSSASRFTPVYVPATPLAGLCAVF